MLEVLNIGRATQDFWMRLSPPLLPPMTVGTFWNRPIGAPQFSWVQKIYSRLPVSVNASFVVSKIFARARQFQSSRLSPGDTPRISRLRHIRYRRNHESARRNNIPKTIAEMLRLNSYTVVPKVSRK